VITETREVSGFTRVKLSGVGALRIAQTGTESLTISAEDNLLPLLTSEVVDGTLTLGMKQGNILLRPTRPIIFTLTVRDLESIQLSGAGTVEAVNLRTSALSVALSGAGDMTLSGAAQSQTLSISGAGHYKAKDFQTSSTEIKISGAGDATVSASETLDAAVSGAGSVTYYGSPRVTQRITGIGSIKQGR
jgi:hypothetical protein